MTAVYVVLLVLVALAVVAVTVIVAYEILRKLRDLLGRRRARRACAERVPGCTRTRRHTHRRIEVRP